MIPLSHLFAPDNYSLNFFSFAPLLVCLFCLLFFHYFNHLEKKSDVNQSLGTLCLSCSIWLLGSGLALSSLHATYAFFWLHIMYLGIILSAVHLFQISAAIANRLKDQKYILYGIYGLALLVFIWETYYFRSVVYYPFGVAPVTIGGPRGLLYFIGLCFILSFINLVYRHQQPVTLAERRKIRFFILAFGAFALSYLDVIAASCHSLALGYLPMVGFIITTFSWVMKDHLRLIEEHNRKLEKDIDDKSLEISHIVGELKTTQLKLFETGKISAVASLSAGILHQISQPITAIHGFVKFIKKEMNPQDTFYKPICLMEEQSQYLKEMLEDLMELIRHREIKKENINVNVCLNRALNLLNDELRIRRVNWDLVVDDKVPSVHADSVHLQQVFMNVVINAIQALSLLPRGAVRYLKIKTEYNPHQKEVTISFKDTGPGMSLEDKKMIFEPFFSTKTKGTGIGLALCKDLVAEHGGSIDCISSPGEGADFIIRLPSAEKLSSANLGVQRI